MAANSPWRRTAAPPPRQYSLSLPAPDGHTVARTCSGTLWFENTATGRRIAEPRRTRDQTFIWSRDAHWLLSFGPDNVVTMWNASDGSVVARSHPFEVYDQFFQAAFSRDAKQVYVHDGTSLFTLSSESMRPVYPEIGGGNYPVLVPHPVDGSVFILNEGGSFIRMNPQTGDVLETAPRGLLESEDQDGATSPDGTRMVVNGPGRRVRLLDVDKQEYVGTDSKTPWVQPHLRPRRDPVRPRPGRTDPALGRPHRGVPSQPAPRRAGPRPFPSSIGRTAPAWSSPPPTAGHGPWTRERTNGSTARARRQGETSPSRSGSSSFPTSPTSRPAPSGRPEPDP